MSVVWDAYDATKDADDVCILNEFYEKTAFVFD